MNIVYISIGVVVLWTAVVFFRDKKNKNKVICIVKNNCTGCRRCVKRCTRGALDIIKAETDIYAIVKYPDKCTSCGDCLGKCKFNALKLIKRV